MSVKFVRLMPAAICLVALASTCSCHRLHREVESASAARLSLAVALGDACPVAGRLVGFARSRQGASPAVVNYGGFLRAVRQIRRSFTLKRSAPSLADEAVLLAISGKLDEAVHLLEEAGKLAPGDATVMSDLSAVYITRALRDGDPHDYLLALAAAEKACLVAPALAAARFNRALSLERLLLTSAARGAWQDYLSVDRTSGWVMEARSHATVRDPAGKGDEWMLARAALVDAALRGDAALVRVVVTRFPQAAREYGEELLGEWSAVWRDDHPLADERVMSICRQIGAALAARDEGDTMLAEAVAAIEHADVRSGGDRRSRLIEGHLRYGQGMLLYDHGDFEGAHSELVAARRLLAFGGSPFEAWAGYQIARCDYQRFAYARALMVLRKLVRRENARRHPALCGRALWLEGLILLIRGDPASALQSFLPSLADFSRLGESQNLARVHALAGTTLDNLGDTKGAWRHLFESLRLARSAGDALASFNAYTEAATASVRLGEPKIALHFQDEVVAAARKTLDPATIAQALQGRASLGATTGTAPMALKDLEEAWKITERLSNPSTSRSLQGDLLLVRGQLERSSDPERSLVSLEQALSIYRATSYHYLIGSSLYELGLTQVALGDNAAAEADFAAAIEEAEQERGRIPGEAERAGFFSRLHDIFERLASLEVMEGKIAEAFETAERSRARVLLDSMLSSERPRSSELRLLLQTARPLARAEVQGSLPEQLVVVEIAVLSDRLLIWTLHHDGQEFQQVATNRDSLFLLVEDLDFALREKQEGKIAADLAALYELIVRPLVRKLPRGSALVFVPDEPLQGVPFAALFDARSGRYLVQDHRVTMAPSSSLLVHTLRHGAPLSSARHLAALAVGDPKLDRAIFPWLPRLPGALKELEEIRKWLPASCLLKGERATRRAFLDAVGRYPIMHYGGHAVFNSKSPLYSELLFAPAEGDTTRGVLSARDLLGRRLAGTRLVVLSACSTAAGRWTPTEGSWSLARAFLAAGVPEVVAVLWRVDDRDAALFFTSFYRHLRECADAAVALRAAQLELLAQ